MPCCELNCSTICVNSEWEDWNSRLTLFKNSIENIMSVSQPSNNGRTKRSSLQDVETRPSLSPPPKDEKSQLVGKKVWIVSNDKGIYGTFSTEQVAIETIQKLINDKCMYKNTNTVNDKEWTNMYNLYMDTQKTLTDSLNKKSRQHMHSYTDAGIAYDWLLAGGPVDECQLNWKINACIIKK